MMPLLVYPILSLVFQNFLMSSLGGLPGDKEPGFAIAFTSNLTEEESKTFLMQLSGQIEQYEEQFAIKESDSNSESESESNSNSNSNSESEPDSESVTRQKPNSTIESSTRH